MKDIRLRAHVLPAAATQTEASQQRQQLTVSSPAVPAVESPLSPSWLGVHGKLGERSAEDAT